MEQVKLAGKVRNETGTAEIRRQRHNGIIPAIVYRKGEASVPISLDFKAMEKALHTSAGGNVIINLKVEGDKKKERTCIIKEIQYGPISGNVIHLDFNEISLTEEVKVEVPLVTKGEAIGVKQDGGVLEHLLREIQVECLPTDIPQKLEVDITNLKVGDALFVKDIIAPKGVKVLNDPGVRILAVDKPVEIKAEEVALEAAATEPEVTKQKKPEDITAEGSGEKGKEKKE